MATVADLHAPASHRDIRTDKGNGQHETGGAPDAHGEQAPACIRSMGACHKRPLPLHRSAAPHWAAAQLAYAASRHRPRARAVPIDSLCRLGKYSGVAVCGSSGEHPPEDDTTLLVAALNHAVAWYDERVNRALQMVNYYIVASAVLATAYASAINGKHYAVAAVLALFGTAATAVTLLFGLRQRFSAEPARRALTELQDRVAHRLGIDAVRMTKASPGALWGHDAALIGCGLAFLFDISALLYALIH